ncbi:MAG: CpsD/CapB family tyrosine-protein kinase [Gammaproteobacteria bacterium]|nr:CpsD/CapB family tyrosine-protein kinase [Gammaproteobacteria bacterium]
MERIRKALERAGQDRMAATDVLRHTSTQTFQSDLSTGVRYTMTKMVEVPEKTLLDNRIIAALPEHKFKDAYRMMRTRVLQTMRNNGWTSVAVTGPASGCGKTLTAINLAVSLAMEVTHTVLLVDLDLRRPSVHKYFNYEPELGLSDYLTTDVPLHQLLFTPSIDRLVVLPGRSALPNSAEMLRSPRMVALVNEIKTRYPDRLIVFDLPPILAADDALAFSPYTDCFLMVAESGGTKKDDLQKAFEILKNTPLVGTVLNKSEAPSSGYGYGGQLQKKKRFFGGG